MWYTIHTPYMEGRLELKPLDLTESWYRQFQFNSSMIWDGLISGRYTDLHIYKNGYLNLWFVVLGHADAPEFRGSGKTVEEAIINIRPEAAY